MASVLTLFILSQNNYLEWVILFGAEGLIHTNDPPSVAPALLHPLQV